jgi:hypothetical protein
MLLLLCYLQDTSTSQDSIQFTPAAGVTTGERQQWYAGYNWTLFWHKGNTQSSASSGMSSMSVTLF